MEKITSNVNSLLKEAKQLKKTLEKRFPEIEKDIDKIDDEKTRNFFKNSLSLAKENKLNIADFIKNIQDECQQK